MKLKLDFFLGKVTPPMRRGVLWAGIGYGMFNPILILHLFPPFPGPNRKHPIQQPIKLTNKIGLSRIKMSDDWAMIKWMIKK